MFCISSPLSSRSLLFLLCALLLSLATRALADCPLSPPLHGSLGNCTSPLLASGAQCSFACDIGYALSPLSARTSCSATILSAQQCTTCSPGSVLNLHSSAGISKLVGTTIDEEYGSHQGISVSLSGDGRRLAVGGVGLFGLGAVWIWERIPHAIDRNHSWSQVQLILTPSSAPHRLNDGVAFGGVVLLSTDGCTLAVVARNYHGDAESGIFMYTRNATGSYVQQGGVLLAHNVTGGKIEQFYDIALSSDGAVLATGAPYAFPTLQGAIVVYKRQPAAASGAAAGWEWVQEAFLSSEQAPAGGQLGEKLAMDASGNTIVASAPFSVAAGAFVFVFVRDSTAAQGWRQDSVISAPRSSSSSSYIGWGTSLGMDANASVILVGASELNSIGGAFSYRRAANGSWEMFGPPLSAPTESTWGSEGDAIFVSADGQTVLLSNTESRAGAGGLLLFSRGDEGYELVTSQLWAADWVGKRCNQGTSPALSADGSMIAWGGPNDTPGRGSIAVGAAWAGPLVATCDVCPAGSTCTGTFAQPVTCSSGSFCPPGSATPTNCANGTFSLPGSGSSLSCETCPRGFVCPSPSEQIACAAGTRGITSGCFGSVDACCSPCSVGSTTVGQNASAECTACGIGEQALTPGMPLCARCLNTQWSGAPNSCEPCASAGCTGGEECVPGYFGTACSQCLSSFFEDNSGPLKQCRLCTTSSPWVPIVALLVLLLLAGFFVRLSSSPLGAALLEPLLIGSAYSQLLSFTRLIHLSWSPSAASAIAATSVSAFNLELFSETTCFISFDTQFWVILGFPVAFGVVLSMLRLGYSCVPRARQRGEDEPEFGTGSPKWGQRLARYVTVTLRVADTSAMSALLCRSMLSVLVFSYPFLAWTVLQIFDCTSIAGVQSLRQNPAVVCGSRLWHRYATAAYVGAAVYVLGIPLLLFCVLRRSDAHRYLTSLCLFRLPVRWWLLAQELWKLAAVLTLRLLLEYPKLQVTLFAGLLGARIIGTLFLRPHADKFHNREEQILASGSLAVLLVGVTFYLAGASLPDAVEKMLFALIVAAIFFMGVVVAGTAYYSVQRARVRGQQEEAAAAKAAASDDEAVGTQKAEQAHDPSVAVSPASDADAADITGSEEATSVRPVELSRLSFNASPQQLHAPLLDNFDT